MKYLKIKLQIILLLLSTFSINSFATLIVDDFEQGLSAWTVNTSSGQIVADPLNGLNSVLTFNRTNSAGDIFTLGTVTSVSNIYTISFDYLGMPGLGGNAGDLGGYIGYSQSFPGTHTWIGGTGSYGTPLSLTDDGTWNHYEFTFTSSSPIHLMIEDWGGSRGVAGDVFFDNVVIGDSLAVAAHKNAIPEPSTIAIFALGIMGLASRRFKKKS